MMTPVAALATGTIVKVGSSEMAKQPERLVIKNTGATVIRESGILVNKQGLGTDRLTLCLTPK